MSRAITFRTQARVGWLGAGWLKRPQWCRVATPPLCTGGVTVSVVRRPCGALRVLRWSALHHSSHDNLHVMGEGGGGLLLVKASWGYPHAGRGRC